MLFKRLSELENVLAKILLFLIFLLMLSMLGCSAPNPTTNKSNIEFLARFSYSGGHCIVFKDKRTNQRYICTYGKTYGVVYERD